MTSHIPPFKMTIVGPLPLGCSGRRKSKNRVNNHRISAFAILWTCVAMACAGRVAGSDLVVVDSVRLGEASSEKSHQMQGEKTQSGRFQGRAWRDARDGGWFSYRMQVLPDAPVALRCVYWGNNYNRISDFFCDEKRLAAQIENFDRMNQFWTAEYPIPQAWTANKQALTIKLQARPGKVGGTFSWEIVRRDKAPAGEPRERRGLQVRPRFVKLPLGAVKPAGWLKRQLEIQAQGLTGYVNEFALTDSQWKGGRGNRLPGPPYRYMSNYLEGLAPLAWLLDDARLKAKARPYIEWLLTSGRPDGWFGPPRQDENEEGVANNAEYLACALKMLIEYSEATGDARVLPLAENYLRYLDHNVEAWRREFWWGTRSMEHALVAYWVYQKTGNTEYLGILDRIQRRSGYRWSQFFAAFPWDDVAVARRQIPLNYEPLSLTAHGVALAWAVKFPGARLPPQRRRDRPPRFAPRLGSPRSLSWPGGRAVLVRRDALGPPSHPRQRTLCRHGTGLFAGKGRGDSRRRGRSGPPGNAGL